MGNTQRFQVNGKPVDAELGRTSKMVARWTDELERLDVHLLANNRWFFFLLSFSSLVLLIIPTIRLQIVVKVDINNNNTRIKEKNNHHFSSIKTKQQLQKKMSNNIHTHTPTVVGGRGEKLAGLIGLEHPKSFLPLVFFFCYPLRQNGPMGKVGIWKKNRGGCSSLLCVCVCVCTYECVCLPFVRLLI